MIEIENYHKQDGVGSRVTCAGYEIYGLSGEFMRYIRPYRMPPSFVTAVFWFLPFARCYLYEYQAVFLHYSLSQRAVRRDLAFVLCFSY